MSSVPQDFAATWICLVWYIVLVTTSATMCRCSTASQMVNTSGFSYDHQIALAFLSRDESFARELLRQLLAVFLSFKFFTFWGSLRCLKLIIHLEPYSNISLDCLFIGGLCLYWNTLFIFQSYLHVVCSYSLTFPLRLRLSRKYTVVINSIYVYTRGICEEGAVMWLPWAAKWATK